jgi:sn-glycerol 3-phosphate transport system substrate-binding protein
MMSFPFNSSTTIMFYNKDMFAKAGLDPEKPPVTWQEFVGMAAKIKASGASCLHHDLAILGAFGIVFNLAQR